jgi:hypothetical protein
MELKQVIDIAQKHLDSENIPLSDVLDAFQTFIDENTPLTEKYRCTTAKYLYQVWDEAAGLEVIISDEEALDYLKTFYVSEGSLQSIDDDFERDFERRFRDATKGSLFIEAVKTNDIQRIRMILYTHLQRYGYGDDFEEGVESGLYFFGDKHPLITAIELNRKEIVEILLEYGALVTDEIIEQTTDPELRKILENARLKQEKNL